MKFKKGQSGNPNGRPVGSASKRSQLAKLLEPHADALISKTVELALNGDTNALRLCIERLIPKGQPDSLSVTVPDITQLENANPTLLAHEIIKSLAGDVITIEQAKTLFTLCRQLSSADNERLNETDTALKEELRELRNQLDKKYAHEY